MFTPTLLELLLLTQQNKSMMRSVPDPSFLCEETGTQTRHILVDAVCHIYLSGSRTPISSCTWSSAKEVVAARMCEHS